MLDLQTQTISQLKASSLERSYLRSEIEKYPDFVKTGETLSEDPTSYDPVWLSYHSILVNLENQKVGMESRVGAASPELKAIPPENPMSADRIKWEHIHRVFELCNRNVSETARR